MTKSIKYQDYLIESLKDPKEAAGYLNAALKGGDISIFLLALQNVIQAQGGEIPNKETAKAIRKAKTGKGVVVCKNANDMFKKLGI
jgi:DNA-binding phage protein